MVVEPVGSRSPYPIPTKRSALFRTAQVLLAGARERVGGSVGAEPRGVPRSPQEITATWLTDALCDGVPGARVLSVSSIRGSAGTTTRAALELAYNPAGVAAGLPTRLFVKSTTSLAQRLMLGLGGLIDGEPGFYAHVRPLLEIEAPRGYFGAVDQRSWRSIVLTEDVASTRGARFWAPGAALSRGQIEDLLSSVAAWHGALWNSPHLNTWRWLKSTAEQMHVIDALIGMANRLPAGARRAQTVLPPALRDRQADIYEAMRRSMHALAADAWTYLHGDLHVANTYLTGAGRVGVADWQVAMKGSWAHDYSYLLATALEIEDRRAWERDLLDFYRERLAAAGGEALSRERAWDAYRAATLYPYFAWVYTIGRSRLQPRFQPDEVALTMIERIAAAIDDLGSLAALGI